MTLCVRCWEKMFNHTGMPAVAHAQSESSKPWLENRAVNRNYSSSPLPLKHTRRRSSSRKPSWGIESTWPRARNPKADSRAKAQRPKKSWAGPQSQGGLPGSEKDVFCRKRCYTYKIVVYSTRVCSPHDTQW